VLWPRSFLDLGDHGAMRERVGSIPTCRTIKLSREPLSFFIWILETFVKQTVK
jgi:hypothetical protein